MKCGLINQSISEADLVGFNMGECIEAKGHRTPTGYVKKQYDGKSMQAHRVAWIKANGAIEKGLCVCHTCDNPACINLNHLFLGTQADNMADMVKKGRQVHGERQHNAKLTDDIVRHMRKENMRPTDAARIYGVSKVAASKVMRGITWKHV